MGNKYKISVLVITHNPRMDLLQWGLDSLEAQTLGKDQWEVVVVDNASPIPLDEVMLRGNRTFNLRVLQEPRLGLSWGRYCGIKSVNSPWIVFLDDDNWFYSDYLEKTLEIAKSQPQLGAFGGISEGVFEKPIRPWMEPRLPFIGVRNLGDTPLFSETKAINHSIEPIGAGMVVAKAVGEMYLSEMEQNQSISVLGRTGSALMSGEDTFLARLAYRQGLSCAYQPALRIKHFMKSGRLNGRYLRQLAFAMGRSGVLLERMLGEGPVRNSGVEYEVLWEILKEYPRRIQFSGYGSIVEWSWMVGRQLEIQGISTTMKEFTVLRRQRTFHLFACKKAMVQAIWDGLVFMKFQLSRIKRVPARVIRMLSGS